MQRTPTKTVMTTEKISASQAALAANRRSPRPSPAPNLWATGIENPLHTPMQNPLIMKLMELVEPTDASAETPRHFPTTIVSTIL